MSSYSGLSREPIACTRIAKGKGVCGTSWERNEVLVVPDVDAFPGHIACSSASRSEIVVPVVKDGVVVAVLDVDSTELADFDDTDALIYLNSARGWALPVLYPPAPVAGLCHGDAFNRWSAGHRCAQKPVQQDPEQGTNDNPGAVNVTFDEYVKLNDPAATVTMNPNTGKLTTTIKRKTVTITWDDSFLPIRRIFFSLTVPSGT